MHARPCRSSVEQDRAKGGRGGVGVMGLGWGEAGRARTSPPLCLLRAYAAYRAVAHTLSYRLSPTLAWLPPWFVHRADPDQAAYVRYELEKLRGSNAAHASSKEQQRLRVSDVFKVGAVQATTTGHNLGPLAQPAVSGVISVWMEFV